MDDEAIIGRLQQMGASTLDEIASDIGVPALVLQGLLEDLRAAGEVKRSPHARWFVPGFVQGSQAPAPGEDSSSRQRVLTQMATYLRLCAFEEEGASARLESSQRNQLWVNWPDSCEWSFAGGRDFTIAGETAQRFTEAVGILGARLIYGYPVWVKPAVLAGDSWQAIPVLAQGAEIVEVSPGSVKIRLADEYPVVNPAFLEAALDLPEERYQFVDDMGLLGEDAEAGVSIHACAIRLAEVGLPYPLEFVDQLKLNALNELTPLDSPVEGVHNAAVVSLVESLKYRKGLASELDEVAARSSLALRDTVLRSFVGAKRRAATQADVVQGVDLPLDDAQLAVVRAALGEQLTVVTGPPGTGKSQIVVAILANAMMRGERVLFASYNHKAVQVVERKLNSIAGFRALLRCGRSREERCHFTEVAEEIGDFLGGVLPEEGLVPAGLGPSLRARRVEMMRQTSEHTRYILEEMAETARSLSQDGWTAFPTWLREFPAASETLPLWCVTNLSARWSLPLEPGLFDLIIIDEASQCDIASAWPLLFRARRAVVIGDSRQLRHVTSVSPERSRQLAALTQLPLDTFDRTDYATSSLFDCAAATVGQEAVLALDGHYRSHPDIIGFPNNQWYDGAIRVLTDSASLVLPGDLPMGMYWLPVRSTVTAGGTGITARDEARVIVDRLRALLVDGDFSGTVGIVTPFRAQRDLIQATVDATIDPVARSSADLLVKTAHGFQGDERDVIFFSPCLRPNITRGSFRFLRDTDNLLNVALTRARSALVIVGDLEACRECGISHYEALALYWDALRAVKAVTDRRVGDDEAVFDKLVVWRRDRAAVERVEPARVLGDDALRAISAVRPSSKAELAMIKGIGAVKLDRYGDEILELLG